MHLQNGVGAFILQCKRLDFHYCDWAGSSRGMNKFLQSYLPTFAKKNPQIEISVSPRPGHHPVVRGVYMNGHERPVCVKNMTPHQILEKAERLKSTSGEKQRKENRAGRRVVTSLNESVRGVWSPYHAKEPFRL